MGNATAYEPRVISLLDVFMYLYIYLLDMFSCSLMYKSMVSWLGQHMAIFLQLVSFYVCGGNVHTNSSSINYYNLQKSIFEISTFWIDVLQWAEGVFATLTWQIQIKFQFGHCVNFDQVSLVGN